MANLRPTTVFFSALASLAAQSGFAVPTLETALNSSVIDTNPHLSFDGLTLYFESNRPGGAGGQDIWVSTRPYIGGPWSTPVHEVAINTASSDGGPFLDLTGRELYFNSNRPGSQSLDIWVVTRAAPGLPWGTPQMVTELNSSGGEFQFSMTLDGLECFFLTTGWGNPGGANNSIYSATRATNASPWSAPTLVGELFNGNTHRDCEISWDGLQIVYTEFSNARLRVFAATRPDRSTPFGVPVLWTEFDTVGTLSGVFGVTMSQTGDEMILAAGFPTTSGNQELLRTRRSVSYGVGCGASAPLELQANAPTIGNIWQLDTTQLEPTSSIAFKVIGGAPSALPLAGFGAPGCTQYVDNALITLIVPNINGTASLSFSIPNDTAFVGLLFWSQSAGLSNANSLGLVFSAGLQSLIGG